MGRLLRTVALATALSTTTACAGVAESLESVNDTCELACGAVVLVVVGVPCAIANGAGFVAGACARCNEGPPQDNPPPPEPAAELAAPEAAASAAMDY